MVKLLILQIYFVSSLYSLPLLADSLRLVQNDCSHLDTTEVERLISLELSQTDASWPYQITLTCEGETVRIVTHHEQAEQELERFIELNEADLKERIVALTVSQLVNAEIASVAAEEATQSSLEPSPPPVAPVSIPKQGVVDHVAISIGGGIKPHHEFSLPTGYGIIRTGMWVRKNFGLISILSFEGGRTKRDPGSVKAMCGLFGLGVVWQPSALMSRHLRLELSSTASMGYTHLEGIAGPDAADEDSVGGVASEFVIGLGGVLEAKGMFVTLDILGGYTVKNPIGRLEDTGRDQRNSTVTWGGFWVGGGLRMGFAKK